MNLRFVNCLLGLGVCFFATLIYSGPLAAGGIETQCRSAVRAEMKGPNCKMSDVSYIGNWHPCGITDNAQITVYNDKVAQCVAHGGPGKR
jgi:hypothetical protein